MDNLIILRDNETADIIGVFDAKDKSIDDIIAFVNQRQKELDDDTSDVDILLDELKLDEFEYVEWFN